MPKKRTPEHEAWLYATGRRFKKSRLAARIKQKDMATLMEITPTQLCHFENGETSIPPYAFYVGCKALGKCMNAMAGRKGKVRS